MNTLLAVAVGFPAGFALWILFEYLLHRFAMHHLGGRGIMSREHLEHHVAAGWEFTSIHLLSWSGMLLVGFVAWMPLGWIAVSLPFGLATAVGWTAGYFFYEYQHAMAHLKAPKTSYQRWVRKHHFHHHFGHPMANHGVTVGIWDKVFGTYEAPDVVRVPRRMSQAWMLDEHGELKAEFAGDYLLVGSADGAERAAQLDRARAFASMAPAD